MGRGSRRSLAGRGGAQEGGTGGSEGSGEVAGRRGRAAETPARPAPARHLQLLTAAGVPTNAGTLTPGEAGERVGERASAACSRGGL